ncbi:bestrophin-4 isoform X2 [Ictalurus punctatus]|uniref:Bestrophin homolog n=1 Tax=Ictalurus punctatus TaxID=7998 RepID=A0A9F7RI59_ICTPU|nr:bestrophin-4 isoform X2 [Ictalurus punctatus]
MTVSYTLEVANARFAGFTKLLFRWKGSIYKLLYKEFLVFCFLYGLFSVIYRCVLSEVQQELFERAARHCNKFAKLIPMSFVLGFYISTAFQRWWGQYTSFPLPDNLMMVVSGNVHGVDERGRMMRRTLMRYANLSSVLILRSISTRVRKRFRTLEDIVEAGFMTEEELKTLNHLHSDFNKYWMPLTWFANLASRAREEGRVKDDIALRLLMDELNNYRGKCSMLFHYDWISIPLVYTQVVTVAVYSFFAFCLIGRQFVRPEKADDLKVHVDLYVPVFTLLEFFFYAGWLKVSMLAVDDMHQNLPPLQKDKYWTDKALSRAFAPARPVFMGSTYDMRVTDEDVEEVMADYRTLPVSVWPPAARKQKKSRGVKQLCCCSKHADENACEREAEKINMIPNKTSAPEQCEDTTQTQCAVALEPSDEDQHTDQTSSDH